MLARAFSKVRYSDVQTSSFLQAAMEPVDVAFALRVMCYAVRRWVTPSPESVSKKHEQVNCVSLSVVSVPLASRLLSGSGSKTACSTAASAASVRERCERFQPTISRVQQSISLTKQARPIADLSRSSSCRTAGSDWAGWLPRGPAPSDDMHADVVSAPAARVRPSARSTRLRFTGSPFFRCNHHVTRR